MKKPCWGLMAVVGLAVFHPVNALPAAETHPGTDAERLRTALSDLEKYAETGMKDWQVPGLAIAIVQGDKVVYGKAFGVKTAGRPEPVTTSTVFQIGSTSKAFTAALVAMMVDEGKVGWEDRVIDHLADFRMYDPWVTREFTIGDLLAQHSGMPAYAGDGQAFLGFDRDHIIRSLRFIKPVSSFRSRFAYVNNLFLVAGKVVERYTGRTWEEALAERIFKPLGMAETSAGVDGYTKSGDVATPHNIQGGKVAPLPLDMDWVYIYGPAGGINSNVLDMAQWIRLQINDGTVDGKKLVSAENMDYTHSPKTIAGPDPRGHNVFYCLSWVYEEGASSPLIWHNGGTTGCHTMIAFWPRASVGIVVLSNQGTSQLPEALARRFGDLYFGAAPRDWSREGLEKVRAAAAEAKKERPAPPVVVVPPLPLEKYSGTYRNDVYESLRIEAGDNALAVTIGPRKMRFPLQHWDRDAFILSYPVMGDEASETFVRFQPDEGGAVKTVVLDLLNQDGCGTFERAD
jgi:CubicO group peptidase (beta-lactamase class C family)